MRGPRTLLTSVALLSGVAVVTAQAPTPPQKESQPIPSGDSAIVGRVIDRASEGPIAGALITLTSVDRRRTLLAYTDSAGRYEFTSIAAGEYRVIASHTDYVTTEFGLREGRRAATNSVGVVQVEREATKSGVDISLPRASTITGKVTRHDGQPLHGANVVAVPEMDDEGLLSVPPNAAARTNARGEYVLSGLPDGSYQISATWGEESGVTGKRRRPVLVYYPGSIHRQEQVPVRVAVGRTLNGIDIVVPASELLRVSGKLVYSGTGLVTAFVTSIQGAQPVEVAADGTFRTPVLSSGRYTLVARARNEESLDAVSITVEVSSFEITDLVLGLMPTGTISGRVVTDDGTAVPDEMQVAAVFVSSDGKELEEFGGGRDRAEIGARGAFEMRGIFGERVLRMVGVTAGWKIARVVIGKTEVSRVSIPPGATIADVVIVLSRS